MDYISGDQGLLNRLNKSKVLNILRIDGPTSRIKLSTKTGLDAKTITNISTALLKEHLIIPGGFDLSTGGRKPELLKLNKNYGLTVGIDLGATHLTGIITDFIGTIIHREHCPIDPDEGQEKILNKSLKIIDKLVKFGKTKKNKILGISFVLPGIMDIKKGLSVYAANIKDWQNVPLGQIINKKFNMDVTIDDASRAMALGERWFGQGRNMDDFVFLDLGAGIGCGIINNGRLYRGASLSAGEIGHTVVAANNRQCRCGNRGCLETVASGISMPELAREQILAGRKSKIVDLVGGDLQKITGENISRAAQNGDRLARQILKKAGQYLGAAVANMINILNPKSIIIGGGLSKTGNLLLEPMKESITSHTVPTSLKQVKILYSQLGDNAAALGAVSLVLEKIFEV